MRHLAALLLLPTASAGQDSFPRELSGSVPLLAILGVILGGLFIIDAFYGLRTTRAAARAPARIWRNGFAIARRRLARARRSREQKTASDELAAEIQEWFEREEAKGRRPAGD